MPVSICGHQQGIDTLTIIIPISDALVRNACDIAPVAQLAGDLAAKTARAAVFAGRAAHQGNN